MILENKIFLLFSFFCLGLLTSCSKKIQPKLEVQYSDVIRIQDSIIVRDTTIQIPGSLATLSVPDSFIGKKEEKTDKAKITLYKNKEGITADCECDTLEIQAKLKEKYRYQEKEKETIITETKAIPYTPKWVKTLAFIGSFALVYLIIRFVLKLKGFF